MLSRREFLARYGSTAAAVAAAVCGLPEFLALRGWWRSAYAQEADVVLDTYQGLAAMVWPGDDPYSTAQGEAGPAPGAVGANAARHIIVALDGFLPQPEVPPNDGTVPLSGSIASAINSVALTVNPAASSGMFVAPFARLTFPQKVATWRVLEEQTQLVSGNDPSNSAGVLQFVFGLLPGFVQFFAFSEIDVLDPATRTLNRRPPGWDHCHYQDGRLVPVEGWDDFLGYYQDRREVDR